MHLAIEPGSESIDVTHSCYLRVWSLDAAPATYLSPATRTVRACHVSPWSWTLCPGQLNFPNVNVLYGFLRVRAVATGQTTLPRLTVRVYH